MHNFSPSTSSKRLDHKNLMHFSRSCVAQTPSSNFKPAATLNIGVAIMKKKELNLIYHFFYWPLNKFWGKHQPEVFSHKPELLHDDSVGHCSIRNLLG